MPAQHPSYCFPKPSTTFVSFLRVFTVSRALSEPIVPCCDVCDPSLLDLTRPGLRPTSTTKKLTYSKDPNKKVLTALREWRRKVYIDDEHPSYFAPSYLLSEEAINKIARLSPCTEAAVEGYLSPQWVFWTKYGPDVTAITLSLQPQYEEIRVIPSPAADSQDEDQNEGLDVTHDSGDARHATRLYKRRAARSCSPIDSLLASTEQGLQRSQKRARRAVTNTPGPCKVNMETFSSSQSQISHLPFSQPDASPAPSHSFPPPQLPVPSQSHSHSVQPNAPHGPSPYQLPLPSHSTQPAWSIPSGSWHTPTHSSTRSVPLSHSQPPPHSFTHSPHYYSTPVLNPAARLQLRTPTPVSPRRNPTSTCSVPLSHSQPLPHSFTHSPHYYSTPVSNPAARLQLRTPTPVSPLRNPTSTPTPNASRLYPHIFGVSTPHTPFHSPLIAPSSSGGPHMPVYQHHPTFESTTRREPVSRFQTPLPLSQDCQHVPPLGNAHAAMPDFGLFTPFPSAHPMVPPEENHNIRNHSFH